MPRTVALRIVPLADRPDLTATVGRWHWDEWGGEDPAGSAEAWIARVATYAERDAIPALYVALDDEEPVGSASLVSHDLPDRDDLVVLTAGAEELRRRYQQRPDVWASEAGVLAANGRFRACSR